MGSGSTERPRHGPLELPGEVGPCAPVQQGERGGLSGSREHPLHHSTAFWLIRDAGTPRFSHPSPCASDPMVPLTSKRAFRPQQEGGNEARRFGTR